MVGALKTVMACLMCDKYSRLDLHNENHRLGACGQTDRRAGFFLSHCHVATGHQASCKAVTVACTLSIDRKESQETQS